MITWNLLISTELTNKLLPNIASCCTNKKEITVSENAGVLCSGTAGIFKALNGIMHRTNQFIIMMKPTLMQVP